jgi:hypothetical protein
LEAVKAMIHDQYLPMHLWEEATKTTMYMQNKIPHKVLESKTPKEMFSGEKPKINHFRIFGSLVFVHVPKKRGQIWILPDGRAHLLVTVTHRRLTRYTFSVIEKWRSVEM